MAYRRERGKTDLDLTGFLSVMSIVTGLICLILFVIALRIAMNPKLKKIVSFRLFTSVRAERQNPKEPAYVDCWSDRVVIYPGEKTLTWDELRRPDNELERLLNRIEAARDDKYVIVMVRPKSVDFYRAVRGMVGKRDIDIGYDVVDAEFVVNWNERIKALGISEEE